jgi:hypothetical protein
MKADQPITVLVVPDSHAAPDQDLKRYTLLGRMICDVMSAATGPRAVVNIGDWFDMASLNTYDRPGSRAFEGRRYRDDIEAGLEAQRIVWREIADYNRPRRGDARLELDWHYCIGNHEARISRCVESDPAKLDGILSLDHLTTNQPIPWQVHDFLRPVFIGGVAFCHYFTSGVMGRAVGGENPAATILRKQMVSCVQGHTHTLDFSERTSPTPDGRGRKISALVCGYFGEYEEWAGVQTNALWSPGVAVLHISDGGFDFSWMSYDRIEQRYG